MCFPLRRAQRRIHTEDARRPSIDHREKRRSGEKNNVNPTVSDVKRLDIRVEIVVSCSTWRSKRDRWPRATAIGSRAGWRGAHVADSRQPSVRHVLFEHEEKRVNRLLSGCNGPQQSEQDGLFMWSRLLVSSAERMTSKPFDALGERLPSRRVLAVGLVAALLVFAGCMGGGGGNNSSEGTTAMDGGAAEETTMMEDGGMAEETTMMEDGEETMMEDGEETTMMGEEETMMEGTDMGTEMEGTEMMGNTTTEAAA